MQRGAFRHDNVIACRTRLPNQIGRWDRARERSWTKAEHSTRRARRANNEVVAIHRQQRVGGPIALRRQQNPRVGKSEAEIFRFNDACRVRHCVRDEMSETFSQIRAARGNVERRR